MLLAGRLRKKTVLAQVRPEDIIITTTDRFWRNTMARIILSTGMLAATTSVELYHLFD
jgi:hypothetical protein